MPNGLYTGTTGTDGKTSIAVPFIPKAEYWVTAIKRGYESKDRLVLLEATVGSGTIDAPPITLKKKAGEEERPPVAIAVNVKGEDGQGIPGAAITIKGPEGSYNGTTDGEGKTSVSVPFIPKAEYSVGATKRDYEPKDRMVLLGATMDSATVDAPPITMKKGAPRAGIRVTFKVTKAGTTIPVRQAHIKVRDMSKLLSDDYYLTTNSEGVAPVRLPGPGSYPFAVTHDSFEPQEGQVQLGAGDPEKNLDIALKEIASDKTVTVTVLAGDVKNGRGGNEPLRGATVTGGQGSGITDSRGIATLTVRPYAVDAGDALNWAEKVELTVSANGYKSQTKTVQLKQQRIGQPWLANETFVMEAGEDKASDDTPIKIVVEVRDPLGLLEVADVTLASLGSGQTDSKGERLFDSGKRSAEELARLRKGIAIKVTRKNHNAYEKTIPADLLQPSNEPRRYSVQLDLDWHDLKPALTSLEEDVAAWKSTAGSINQKATSLEALSNKVATSKTRVEVVLADLKRKRKDADTKRSDTECEEAQELRTSIKDMVLLAGGKEKALRAALDDAIKLAANCKAKGDGDIIRTKHKSAIVLTGELGKLEKQVREKNQKLTTLAQNLTSDSPAGEFQKSIDKIEDELTATGKDAASADNNLTDLMTSSKGLPGRRAELLQKLNALWGEHYIRKYEAFLPPDLSKRLKTVEDSLNSRDGDLSMAFAPSVDRKQYNVIKQTVEQLQKYKNEAVEILESYKQTACDVKPEDEAGELIGRAVVGATVELAAASDLSEKATACDAAVAAAEDQVTVPDVSGYADIGGMKAAAAGAGLVPALVATKATPPPGTVRLFAGQAPAANTKAKKGSALTIMLYQRVAQASPTPSPTPSAIAKVTPSPGGDEEVRVPDLSVFDGIVEMKAAASHVGLVPALAATKATPPPGATRLFAGQDPPAGSTAKRGSSLKILVYQKAAETAAASPSPSASPGATVAVAGGNMPNLIGLTLDQAVSRLPRNMRVGSDEIGDKPPSPDLALTIFSQTPAPGANVDTSKSVVISVKRYGSSRADATTSSDADTADSSSQPGTSGSSQANTAARFDGTYVGSYSGADKGRVRFSVNGGTITISSPGSGSGRVSASGRASISGAGADGDSSYTFNGTFSVNSNGGATASGRWSGQQQGFTGTGRWSAARQ